MLMAKGLEKSPKPLRLINPCFIIKGGLRLVIPLSRPERQGTPKGENED